MQKEIILYFDEPKEIDVDFYNYDYDHEYPSQTININAKTVKIKNYNDNIEQRCYITNATSIELVDYNDDCIYHTVPLLENNKIRVITEQFVTVIAIY